ncbi:MAG: enoyl-CoA hydratase-related protein [Pseudomonadota bacterium]
MTTVIYDTPAEAVVQITLNRPEALNSFNKDLRGDLTDAIATASADMGVRAVVLTGAGRGFSAGADITDMSSPRNVEDQLNAEYAAFLNIIKTCEKPVIAAINGPAAGIGMTLALTCDLRVMGESAYLMSAFANIGLVPDGGLSLLLTQLMGYSRAYQAAIEAEKMSAETCLRYDLTNRVVADDAVVSEAVTWASTLAERAPVANALTKRAFRAAVHGDLASAASFEAMLQRAAIQTEDCQEGIAAVLQKRKPQFKGR